MLEARTVSVSIAHPWEEAYEAVWRPADFPKWASGLSALAALAQEGHGRIAVAVESADRGM